MAFEKVRKKHKQLIYEGFKIEKEKENLKITFDFLLTPNIRFNPTITFPNLPLVKWEPQFESLVFNLGMVELLSYWKAACPPEIIIKAGYLNEDQIKFWKNLLIKGLGEFFYNNKIDFTKDDLVAFKVNSHIPSRKLVNKKLQDKDLILVGGGKDSAVTLEIISRSGREFAPLVLNPNIAAKNIAEIDSCCITPVYIKRTIDSSLLKLNQSGYLNGHTPFSAYLAFVSTLAAEILGYKNIIVSNESSSNEGNIEYLGQTVNHQYSKTFEFENLFREYSKKYLSNTNYFSFLRPLTELQISEIFSQMSKYHKISKSCNKGLEKGIWCGNCSKCLSTYLVLYPFLEKNTQKIFGKDLLNDKKLIPVVKGLLREDNEAKPFDCVATIEEIKVAIFLGIEQAKKDCQRIPLVLDAVKKSVLNKPQILKSWNKENNLSQDFEKLLKEQVKSYLILGFGREGKSTQAFLSKYFSNKKIGTSDKLDGIDYLKSINNYDVIIKSPGIPFYPEIIKAKKSGKLITSATQIFFDNFKGKIIGVTGTKGKSTAASLIYDVLKKGGKDVYLGGNIGKPALDLLDQTNENSIVVLELSSFQLEDLTKSPHIAVITNLYPEHLDHHGDFENYKNAKFNITKYQTKNDYFIYNNNTTELKEFSKKTLAKTFPFSDSPIFIIGHLFKVSNEKISQAIKNFKSLPHRLEFIGEFKSIKFYNDSLATIPQATIRALDILGRDVETLIAGGFDRGIDYSILGPAIDNSKIENLILFPTTGEKISKVVSRDVKNFNVDNMKDAVKIAFEKTSPGKIVLLSPASSSFNLFKDYEDRGNQFKKWVSQY